MCQKMEMQFSTGWGWRFQDYVWISLNLFMCVSWGQMVKDDCDSWANELIILPYTVI